MTWQPQRYLAFDDHRTRPAADLLARVPLAAPERVVDLGCGPGNSTALLTGRWPGARVTGLDSSDTMLAAARERGLAADWLQADIATWVPDQPVDLLFSNAVLQWLPHHATVLPRLLGLLRPGGVLAIQMPRNFQAPSHTTVSEIAALAPWAERLEGRPMGSPVAEPEWYHDVLSPKAAALDIWQTEYLQVLEGEDPVVRWVEFDLAPPGTPGPRRGGRGPVQGDLRRPHARSLSETRRRPHPVPVPPPVPGRPGVATSFPSCRRRIAQPRT